MPTYDFRCPEGHEFERFFRTITAAPMEVACATCGKTAARQMTGGAGLLFKGSGFYITDYGKDGKKDQRERSAKGEKGSEKSAGASSTESGGAASGESAKPAPAKPASSGSTDGGT